MDVFLDGKPAYIRHDGFGKMGFEFGQFFFNHVLYAGILKAHRVDHACFAFGNSGCGIAKARFLCGAFEGKRAKQIDIIPGGEFIAVSKGAACRNNRIVQRDPAEVDLGIYHRISSFSRTGPSLQMRLFPYLVLQLQPIQAPNPHAIRSSKLNCPDVVVAAYTAFSMGSGPQVYT